MQSYCIFLDPRRGERSLGENGNEAKRRALCCVSGSDLGSLGSLPRPGYMVVSGSSAPTATYKYSKQGKGSIQNSQLISKKKLSCLERI